MARTTISHGNTNSTPVSASGMCRARALTSARPAVVEVSTASPEIAPRAMWTGALGSIVPRDDVTVTSSSRSGKLAGRLVSSSSITVILTGFLPLLTAFTG